ncbi:MAG: hypothetical protein H7066_13560 [Cytophagaceae bacterium]|nr:hypothetical protein [Gemmatimonadaceae bacterium]
MQQHRPGYPMGGYWSQFPLRNADGTPQLNAANALLLDTASFIGQSAPAHEVGFANTFTLFRYLRVYGLFDWKAGFWLFNLKERNRCQTANDNCEVVNDPRARFPKTAADTVLAKELAVWRGGITPYIEPADFLKLREVSVTLNAPTSWATRVGAQAASLIVSGRNLALWSDYTGLDPEVNSYGGRNFVRADAYAAPMMRRLSAGINLTF